MKRFLCFVTFLLILASCGPRERNATGVQGAPEIWPDYVGVTVPATIAPLDFTLPGADALDVRVTAPDGSSLRSGGKTATCFSEEAALPPWMERPGFTMAPGQEALMSRSLEPMPLPSFVQKGTIFLPVQSKASSTVNINIGIVPHQLG